MRTRRGGFSLVELMIVVVILGIISTMVLVSIQAMLPRTRLNSAVRDLAATLHEARSDAISRNAEFQVEYYFEEDAGHPRGYRVITPFSASGEGGLAIRNEERLAREWHTLPEEVSFTSITLNGEVYETGQVVVSFDALGGASDHTISLIQAPYERGYTIEVLALTGLIRFHDGDFRREYPKESDFN